MFNKLLKTEIFREESLFMLETTYSIQSSLMNGKLLLLFQLISDCDECNSRYDEICKISVSKAKFLFLFEKFRSIEYPDLLSVFKRYEKDSK